MIPSKLQLITVGKVLQLKSQDNDYHILYSFTKVPTRPISTLDFMNQHLNFKMDWLRISYLSALWNSVSYSGELVLVRELT